jgi:thiosulfate dehydrogenase
MKFFILGLIIGIGLVLAAGYLYVRLGYMPVATDARPLPFEQMLASMALNAELEKRAPKKSPIQATEVNLLAGAQIYREHCAACHGTANGPKTAAAKGMFPPPPQFFQGEDVTDDPVGYTFWTVANGIRLTGMPAFRGALNDEQMWQVSELLGTSSDKLPQSVRDVLARPASAP